MNRIYEGDSAEVLKTFEAESIDTIITDPPYGYSFMNKDWDKAVVPVDTWRQCLRVLKPGAFAAIMSSPRQDVLARMIVNLQDAGFRTDFTSIYWTYASGFPKAANVSKLVDKRLGLDREIIDVSPYHKRRSQNVVSGYQGGFKQKEDGRFISKSNSKEAQELDGSYAGFQPKPAVEVVLMVMKPLSEKSYVDQALANGKGVTWLDDCRIPFDIKTDEQPRIREDKFITRQDTYGYTGKLGKIENEKYFNSNGRFPANLLVCDDVLNDGQQRKSGKMSAGTLRNNLGGYNGPMSKQTLNETIGDCGSYSRFFDLDKWFDTTFPFLAVPKASSGEKNRGLDNWIQRQGTRPNSPDITGKFPDYDHRMSKGNFHPTVKPLKLMSWLVTLLSRPNDTVLDPFCGSGTTLLAVKMLKRTWIGIELNKEYATIANTRLKDYIIAKGLTLYEYKRQDGS